MARKTKKAAMADARANFYNFLARLYDKEVTPELLNAIKKIDFDAACETPEMREGYNQLKAFLENLPENTYDELAADYAKVFLGAGEAEGNAAFPYESVYTGKEKLVMQDAWEKVRDYYAKKGLELKGAETDVKEDHIASELACMAYLAENADVQESLTFLTEHLTDWIDRFADDIKKYARYEFYPALAAITQGFIKADKQYLEGQVKKSATSKEAATSYKLSKDAADNLIKALSKEYRVFAPTLQKKRAAGKDSVRYKEINTADQIYTKRNSDFPAKEAYYPVMQTMLYFKDKDVYESKVDDDRDILLIMHPCDINAMGRLDNIFLKNGVGEDHYYSRLRDKVRVVLLECEESADNCFCVSMGSNKAEDYEMAMRINDNGEILVQIKDPHWNQYMGEAQETEFSPIFITENKKTVTTPHIPDTETLKTAAALEYWNKFDEDCIGCGGCNAVCPTCSCYDVNDIIYDEVSLDGERRRVWSSCMLDTFTQTAGGGRARETAGANMRFKTLHKIHDYKTRFGADEHMCVGCGRCIIRCPKDLDFSATLNEFTEALKQAKGGN